MCDNIIQYSIKLYNIVKYTILESNITCSPPRQVGLWAQIGEMGAAPRNPAPRSHFFPSQRERVTGSPRFIGLNKTS